MMTMALTEPPREAESSLALFALGASISAGEDVAQLLGAELAPLEDRKFEDGEYKIRPLEMCAAATVTSFSP
ncbi:hypothetical protein [Methylocystis rosea]|uniref:hypothetical protein n=1 Tax=Methylocystis rosea TaxID=173366 RepID=UPI001FE1C7AC|nr:hypothetical protein [Methylocystis rosea]